MIMGEHAVLYGKPAIVMAIRKGLTVTLELEPVSPGKRQQIIIDTLLDKKIYFQKN